jgi:asparagine synthase (glutamine-hydrolysing)
MCGICGVIDANPGRVQTAVRSMMCAMVHRGPDDEGYEQVPLGRGQETAVCGLGFRRLAILDLSPAGHQPMFNPETGDCLVFNGEIYNFRAIRRRLESQGVRFRSSGDTEVLLKALSTWGEAALDELDGMFAFAFYESRRRRLLLARDHIGIKPLYVARLPHGLVFASEIRSVLASGLVPDDLDQAGLATVLAYGAPQDPLTVHRWVRSLPAGTCQWVGAEACSGSQAAPQRRYWRFPAAAELLSEESATAAVERVLDESIAAQCVSDVPLAIFLSAGLDSATIAAFARRHVPDLRTFAVGNAMVAQMDETRDAADTAAVIGTVHSQVVLDEPAAQRGWHRWLASPDRPSVDGINTLFVSQAVKDNGMTVALSGLGADELFGGYVTFDETRRLRRLLAPTRMMPVALRRGLAPLLTAPLPHRYRRRAFELLTLNGSLIDLALHVYRIHGDASLASMGFDHERLGLTEQWLPPEAYDAFVDVRHDVFRAVSQVALFQYMGNTLLRDTDVSSMACSLETRVPFLGRSVIDTVGAIPGSVQLPPGPARKRLLRHLARRLLPSAVVDRPKRGFNLPLDRWMNGPLRDDCAASIAAAESCPLLRPEGVRAAWAAAAGAGAMSQSRRLALVTVGNYLLRQAGRRAAIE